MPLADLLPELLELEGKDLTPRATEVLLRLFTALFERTEHQVTREEMQAVHAELREVRVALQQLAEAQVRTEQQVDALAQAQERLAEAQARTEQRVEALAQAQERLAEAQIDHPIVIRVPACPMYPLVLKQKGIEPKHVPREILSRIPYYRRGCAAGMPFGYLVIRANGELNPCMLLQVNLGNVKEAGIKETWQQQSPVLAELRSRSLLKGECSRCEHREACAGCRGRAYEETGDMLASDPCCWHESSASVGED
jgi:radical SAM protein with 4Fe4S-binding SPASM domain